MKQEFYNLKIDTNGQKLYEFTNQTIEWINKNNFKNGILNLSIQHTSASLIVQENADPDVQTDLILNEIWLLVNADLICAGISSFPSVV